MGERAADALVVDLNRQGRGGRKRAQRAAQPEILQRWRIDAAGQRAEVFDCLL